MHLASAAAAALIVSESGPFMEHRCWRRATRTYRRGRGPPAAARCPCASSAPTTSPGSSRSACCSPSSTAWPRRPGSPTRTALRPVCRRRRISWCASLCPGPVFCCTLLCGRHVIRLCHLLDLRFRVFGTMHTQHQQRAVFSVARQQTTGRLPEGFELALLEQDDDEPQPSASPPKPKPAVTPAKRKASIAAAVTDSVTPKAPKPRNRAAAKPQASSSALAVQNAV